MRFPLAPTAKIARHIVKHKLKGTPKFAMVLQLEPLHTCNLTCTGCGRIREYSTSLKDMVPLEQCLAAAAECDAPMISICGGEPLIYPKIEELVAGLHEQGRMVYICTNGVFMRKKMREYLASAYTPAFEPQLAQLLTEKLVTEKEAEAIRKADATAKSKTVIRPGKWHYPTAIWEYSLGIHQPCPHYIHPYLYAPACERGLYRTRIQKTARSLPSQVSAIEKAYSEIRVTE